jgi:hypothetical protein
VGPGRFWKILLKGPGVLVVVTILKGCGVLFLSLWAVSKVTIYYRGHLRENQRVFVSRNFWAPQSKCSAFF